MAQSPLGFVPLIPIIAKAVPAVISIVGGKKKKKAEARAAEYQAAAEQIASGQAVMATDVMTEADKEFLRAIWPQIHVAASFDDPNWSAHGYPGGPQLTPAALAAIRHVWPQVHVANNFDDVNWQYHAVPVDVVAKLLPVPELPAHMQPAPTRNLVDAKTGQLIQASLLPGVPNTVLLAGGVGLALLILFSRQR